MTVINNIEEAIEILQKTNDGDDLAPVDLGVVESWVNGNLSEKGKEYFQKLYTNVAAGKYVKPWMCGVEGLTQNHEGYVFWKGIEVEHYSHSDYTRKCRDAVELARRCQLLESVGVTVTGRQVIGNWEIWERYIGT